MEQETLKKIDEIKAIMKKRSSRGIMGSRRPHKVGIIADAEQNDFWWLHAVLRSHYFSDTIKKIRFISVSDIDTRKTLDVISSCTFYIFICSGYSEETFPAVRRRLGFLFDRENLIIIIDNLEDSSEREKKRILRENLKDCVRSEKNVFLFSRMERGSNYLIHLLNDPLGSVRSQKRDSIDSIYGTSTKNHSRQQRRNTFHGSSAESFSGFGTPSRNQQRPKTTHGGSAGDAGEHSSQVINGHRVGIFSRSSHSDSSWLVEMLRSEDFRPPISDVRSFHIFKGTVIQKVRECTFAILYQSQKTERNTVISIKDILELETLYSTLGKQNVAVVIDDLEDSDDDGKSHTLDAHLGAAQWIDNLLLVSYQDKMEKKSLEMVKAELEKQLQGSDLTKHEPRTPKSLRTFPTVGKEDPFLYTGHGGHSSQRREIRHHRVGIFSRETDRDYSWLVETLESEDFSSLIINVKSCLISNSQKFQEFIDDISQCTFGILYHSKNRGTVNITNVTDSLYDEELETLHMILGKENVLVIIDDLEDSGDARRVDLLQEQPSIAEQAVDLLLVTDGDKKDPGSLRKKTDQLKTLLRGADGSLDNQSEITRQKNQRGAGFSPSLERSLYSSSLPPEDQPSSSVGQSAPSSSRSTIGIFSRSDESDYFWLKRLLTSEHFGQKAVLCYKMSANDNEGMRGAAFKSKFGILYHTVKNGKIRLTDVKDSLYDEELEQLSTKFGKRKMMVVIDDLDDGGDKLKQKILEKQPSLRSLVADIFLFTISEKKNMDPGKDGSKMKKSTMDKISIMKKILT